MKTGDSLALDQAGHQRRLYTTTIGDDMLDYEAEIDNSSTNQLNALDNGHLYAWGQREHCTTGEYILSERLSDALDIIQILAAECRALSTNLNAYDDTNKHCKHCIGLHAVDDFVISGKLDPDDITTNSAWRKGKS